MNSKQTCVADDSYQLAYEHGRQLECAVHLRASGEVYPDKLDSGKYQISDGEKEHFEDTSLGFWGTRIRSVVADMEFKKRISDIPRENAAIVLHSLQAVKGTEGTEASENCKRPPNNCCFELVYKRAKKEDEAGKLGHFPENFPISNTSGKKHFSGEPEWKTAASALNSNGKGPAETKPRLRSATCNIMEVDTRNGQPAGVNLEDVHSPLSRHFRRRRIPIGRRHQADLPQWTPRDFKSSGSRSGFSNAMSSSTVIEIDEASADKWLGTCVIPMPRLQLTPMETQICSSKKVCYCTDGGSIRCVRYHVMEAREKLRGVLGQKKFIELGFPDMGEDVAQRWTREEENLFQMLVWSNSASLGRNFWTLLSRTFSSRSFKEIVSYYFNVFVLLTRADQNRFDPLNVDSDNDEWHENSDSEFAMSEEEEEEEEDDVSEELDFDDDDEFDDEEENEKHLVGTEEDEGFYCGSGGSMGYKPMPCIQPIDRDSRDCSLDQDVQDDSCTSFEGLYNASESCLERHQENLNMEHRDNYEYIDGHRDSKPWEIHYVGATEKDFDFFPTCNVLEEVFGKGSRENDVRDGSGFS